MRQTPPPKGAQAALRAVRLLKLFTIEQPEMSLAQISQAAGLNKTTTHRLLRALQSESLVDRNQASGGYTLGAGLMALGVQALASSDLRRRVRPMLRALARETGETATLEVPFEEIAEAADQANASVVLMSIARDSQPAELQGLIAGVELVARRHEVWLGIPADHDLAKVELPAKVLHEYEHLDSLLAASKN